MLFGTEEQHFGEGGRSRFARRFGSLDGAGERAEGFVRFVAIDVGGEERAGGGRERHGATVQASAEKPQRFRPLIHHPSHAEIRFGELLFAIVEATGKSV